MIETSVLERLEGAADSARLARLFDDHNRRLYRLACRLCRSREEAQDTVQETYLRIAASGCRVPESNPAEEAWLVRVLVNLCRDRWRRAKIRSQRQVSLAGTSWDSDPEPAYLARIAVRSALAQIEPRRRAILVLHELEGVEMAEVSRLLGVSPGTARWHLSKGRRELARLLFGANRRSGRKGNEIET